MKARFGRGGIVVCRVCGKRTRETGRGEGGCELCAVCLEQAGDENSVSDGHMTQDEFVAKWGKRADV